MAYQDRPHFDQPTTEELERSQQVMFALLPIFLLQQGLRLVDSDGGVWRQLLYVAGWSGLSIVIVAVLAGWKLGWMSARDHVVLNDEWTKAARGEAMRYGIVTLALLGVAMMASTIWIEVTPRTAINVLVGVPLLVAGVRFTMLNRAADADDE